MNDRVIRIVAAVIVNRAGQTLLVRKRGTAAFMQAGGKLADGETALEALAREIGEELGRRLDAGACRALGRFRVPAANEPGFIVDADLFGFELDGEVSPHGEIEEAVWIDPAGGVDLILAPLTRRHALPLARSLMPAAPALCARRDAAWPDGSVENVAIGDPECEAGRLIRLGQMNKLS